jgi:hypothetical protein
MCAEPVFIILNLRVGRRDDGAIEGLRWIGGVGER